MFSFSTASLIFVIGLIVSVLGMLAVERNQACFMPMRTEIAATGIKASITDEWFGVITPAIINVLSIASMTIGAGLVLTGIPMMLIAFL